MNAFLMGMRVIQNDQAVRRWSTFAVVQVGGKFRKRKRYSVKRTDHKEPAILKMGDTLVVHPKLMPKLLAATTELRA